MKQNPLVRCSGLALSAVLSVSTALAQTDPQAPPEDAPAEPDAPSADPSAPDAPSADPAAPAPTGAPPSAPAPTGAPPPTPAATDSPPAAPSDVASSTASEEPPPPSDELFPPLDYSAPPPPRRDPDADRNGGFELPPLSFRVDPFNWLLEGRFGVEAEAALLGFMTVELVPVLVVNEKPPTFNFAGAPSELRQESNGIGPLSGGAIDVGFWLDGTPLRGYVIRVGITNESYAYHADDDIGEIDSVEHTERRAFAMFGSHMRWGAFTIAGGIGLGMELNEEERCFPQGATSASQATTSGCKGQLLLAIDRASLDAVDLNGGLHPMYLMGRFSLGIALD